MQLPPLRRNNVFDISQNYSSFFLLGWDNSSLPVFTLLLLLYNIVILPERVGALPSHNKR